MSRYTAPVGFALVAVWAAVVFTILASQPHAHARQSTTSVSRMSSK